MCLLFHRVWQLVFYFIVSQFLRSVTSFTYSLYDERGTGSYTCAINTASWGTLCLVQYAFYAVLTISRTANSVCVLHSVWPDVRSRYIGGMKHGSCKASSVGSLDRASVCARVGSVIFGVEQ